MLEDAVKVGEMVQGEIERDKYRPIKVNIDKYRQSINCRSKEMYTLLKKY